MLLAFLAGRKYLFAWKIALLGFSFFREQQIVDFKQVDSHVHQLKGSSSRYSLTSLFHHRLFDCLICDLVASEETCLMTASKISNTMPGIFWNS
jgi:hypothetical protein